MTTGRSATTPSALVADVGGTNIRLATATASGFLHQITRLCSDFDTLTDALTTYIETYLDQSRPTAAAIAVAGPVTGDQVDLTNQRWNFSTEELRSDLNLEKLIVVNDFTAQAAAIPRLEPADIEPIKQGVAIEGTAIAVLGPGTGLGVSGLVHSGHNWIPLAGEGGHVTLGATNEREWAILEVLQGIFGRVSAERVLSGPGLVNLFRAICQIDGETAVESTPAGIVELAGTSPESRAAEAVRIFSGWLGTVAGDFALTLGAWTGVYLCGGVLPKMGDCFAREVFSERFVDKGRYSAHMERIPVYLVLNTEIAHLGLTALLDQS
jgi:glucokinase